MLEDQQQPSSCRIQNSHYQRKQMKKIHIHILLRVAVTLRWKWYWWHWWHYGAWGNDHTVHGSQQKIVDLLSNFPWCFSLVLSLSHTGIIICKWRLCRNPESQSRLFLACTLWETGSNFSQLPSTWPSYNALGCCPRIAIVCFHLTHSPLSTITVTMAAIVMEMFTIS